MAKLSANEVLQLLELREILEVGACRLAAEKITEEDLGKLKSILQRHLQSQTQAKLSRLPLHYSEWLNYDFHYQIALASGNQRLIDLLCGDIWILMRAYRYPGALSPGRLPQGTDAHFVIMDALARRNPDEAEQAMRLHLRQARANVMEHLTDAPKKDKRSKQLAELATL